MRARIHIYTYVTYRVLIVIVSYFLFLHFLFAKARDLIYEIIIMGWITREKFTMRERAVIF